MTDNSDKKDPWLNWLALTTVILAVCATLATFKGGGFTSRTILNQSLASDQWAFYQAKSVKAHLMELQLDKLDLDLKIHKTNDPAANATYEKMDRKYRDDLARYKRELTQIKQAAEDFERQRDDAQRHSKAFGQAVVFLQMAILLCSIAALLKKKPLWYAGMAIGAAGTVFFADGFWMFL